MVCSSPTLTACPSSYTNFSKKTLQRPVPVPRWFRHDHFGHYDLAKGFLCTYEKPVWHLLAMVGPQGHPKFVGRAIKGYCRMEETMS